MSLDGPRRGRLILISMPEKIKVSQTKAQIFYNIWIQGAVDQPHSCPICHAAKDAEVSFIVFLSEFVVFCGILCFDGFFLGFTGRVSESAKTKCCKNPC